MRRMPPISWQSFLRREHLNNSNIEEVETAMQLSFPGPYVIEEYFDTKSMSFNYRPKFEDTKQETLWRIKWG